MKFTHNQPTKIHFGVDEFEKLGELAGQYGKRCLLVMQTDNPTFEKLANNTQEQLKNKALPYRSLIKFGPILRKWIF